LSTNNNNDNYERNVLVYWTWGITVMKQV